MKNMQHSTLSALGMSRMKAGACVTGVITRLTVSFYRKEHQVTLLFLACQHAEGN